MDTSALGIRMEVPVSLPCRAGMTLPTALAAPVLVGMMLPMHAAGQAPVLLGEAVNDLLGGSVGVDGGHEALDDAEVVVDDLGQRRKAVGGAGSVGHDR